MDEPKKKIYSLVLSTANFAQSILHMGRYATLEEAIIGAKAQLTNPAERIMVFLSMYLSMEDSATVAESNAELKALNVAPAPAFDPEKQTKEQAKQMLMLIRDKYVKDELKAAFNSVIDDMAEGKL